MEAAALDPIREEDQAAANSAPVPGENEIDPIKLKLWRSAAKSTHTKTRNKISSGHRSSAHTLEVYRAQLCWEYEDVKRKHDRCLRFATLDGTAAEAEIDWLRLTADEHQTALAMVDRAIASRNRSACLTYHGEC